MLVTMILTSITAAYILSAVVGHVLLALALFSRRTGAGPGGGPLEASAAHGQSLLPAR